MALYLISHTESMLGQKLHHGDLDPPLSSKGVSKIAPIANLFRGRKLDLIVTPSVERNSETAILLASTTGAHIFVDEGLRTWKQGAFSGLPHAQADAAMKVYLRQPTIKVPQGESARHYLTRWKRSFSKYMGMGRGKLGVGLLLNSLSVMAVAGGFRTVDLSFDVPEGAVYEVKSNMELVKL